MGFGLGFVVGALVAALLVARVKPIRAFVNKAYEKLSNRPE